MWTLLALIFVAFWAYLVYLTYTKGGKFVNDLMKKLKLKKDNKGE